MQRAANRPSADDLTSRDGFLDIPLRGLWKAQPDGPQRAGVILRLQRTQPRDDLPGTTKAVRGDLLIVKAKAGDVQALPFWQQPSICAMPHNPDAICGFRG
jgi:hypothetical protein